MLLNNINSGFKELKKRLFFLLCCLFVLRLGNYISIPGINIYYLNNILNKNNTMFIDILKTLSNGSLYNASIFMLGIMPYISSSIIIQLLTVIIPYFISLRKEGIDGKYKINRYIKFLTLLLSIIQAVFLSIFLLKIKGIYNIYYNTKLIFFITSVISLVTGTVFLMWLGEKITERGIGNGISIIIFTGIISSLPSNILNIFYLLNKNKIFYIKILLILLTLIFMIFFIVLVEMAQRRILIQYAIRGYQNNRYSFLNANDTYLPLKINIAGVMPSVFTSSIMIFPSVFFIWLNNKFYLKKWFFLIKLFYPKQFLYLFLYLSLIFLFCFFYTLLIFNPIEISDNLKKTGAYIPSIRPGIYTSNFIKKIVLNLTIFNAIYISLVCIMPDFIYEILGLRFNFSGTSLLIVSVVIIEFITQIQSLLMSNKYLSILKKTYF